MATRSQIAVRLNDGSYATVHCQYDGYPVHMGWMLHNKFNTRNRVLNLVLDGRSIRQVGYLGDYGAVDYYPNSNEDSAPQFQSFGDSESLLNFYTEILCEYAYVYEDGEFYAYKLDGRPVSEYSSEYEWEMRCLGKLSELKCCTNSNFNFRELDMNEISELCI